MPAKRPIRLAPSATRSPLENISALRSLRAKPAFDNSLSAAIEPIRKQFVRQHKAAAGVDTSWNTHAPANLRPLAQFDRLTPGGLLTLKVSDAAAAYEIDHWLRSGGLDLLRAACTKPLRRVKLVQGNADQSQ